MHLILGGNMISVAEIKNHEMPESSAVVHNIAIDMCLAQITYHSNTRKKPDE